MIFIKWSCMFRNNLTDCNRAERSNIHSLKKSEQLLIRIKMQYSCVAFILISPVIMLGLISTLQIDFQNRKLIEEPDIGEPLIYHFIGSLWTNRSLNRRFQDFWHLFKLYYLAHWRLSLQIFICGTMVQCDMLLKEIYLRHRAIVLSIRELNIYSID